MLRPKIKNVRCFFQDMLVGTVSRQVLSVCNLTSGLLGGEPFKEFDSMLQALGLTAARGELRTEQHVGYLHLYSLIYA